MATNPKKGEQLKFVSERGHYNNNGNVLMTMARNIILQETYKKKGLFSMRVCMNVCVFKIYIFSPQCSSNCSVTRTLAISLRDTIALLSNHQNPSTFTCISCS